MDSKAEGSLEHARAFLVGEKLLMSERRISKCLITG